MRKRISIVLISVLSAFLIMTSGYGLWQKELIIEGNIKIIPDPRVKHQLLGDVLLTEQQSNKPEVANENQEDKTEGQEIITQSETPISGESQQEQESVIESLEPVISVGEVTSSAQPEANSSDD